MGDNVAIITLGYHMSQPRHQSQQTSREARFLANEGGRASSPRVHLVLMNWMKEEDRRQMSGGSGDGHSPRSHSLLRVVVMMMMIMSVKLTVDGNVASTGEGRNERRRKNNNNQSTGLKKNKKKNLLGLKFSFWRNCYKKRNIEEEK